MTFDYIIENAPSNIYTKLPDTLLSTILNDRWVYGIIDNHSLDIQFSLETLYRWNQNSLILSFKYAIINDDDKLYVYFGLIPAHTITISKLFSPLYLTPKKATYISEIPFKTFTCFKLKMVFNELSIKCLSCHNPTYNIPGLCLSESCEKFMLYKIFKDVIIKVDPTSQLLSLEEVYVASPPTNNSAFETFYKNCYRCMSCRICKRLKTPCKRHVICTHANKTNSGYHKISRMNIRNIVKRL